MMGEKTLYIETGSVSDRQQVKLPFAENTFSKVTVSREIHYVDLDTFFYEVNRILCRDGEFEIQLPHLNSREAFEVWGGHFFSEKWFQENIVFNKNFDIQSVDFKVSKMFEELPGWIRLTIPKKVLKHFLFNVYSSMTIRANCKKQAN